MTQPQNINLLWLIAFIPLSALGQENTCCNVNLSGYLDASYNYLKSANQFQSGVFDRAYDITEQGYTLQQAAGTLQYLPQTGFGGLVNGILGKDAFTTAAYGFNPQIGSDSVAIDVLQYYLQYAQAPLVIIAGKYVTLASAEVVDSTSNVNFSRSLLFTFAVPTTHTGIRGVFSINDHFNFILGVNDGWDNMRDVSRGKTMECGFAYKPNDTFSLNAQAYSGIERITPRTSVGPTGLRSLIDIVGTYHVNENLSLIANYDYGIQKNIIDNNNQNFDATWQGLAAYANYKFNDTWRLSVRGEDFNDNNGYRTGLEQTIKEMTLTLGYAPLKNLELRAETRCDISNENSYLSRHSLEPRKSQISVALDVVYKLDNVFEKSAKGAPQEKITSSQVQHEAQTEREVVDASTSNVTYSADEKYLLLLDAHHYVLQLLASQNEANIQQFIKQNALENKAHYFEAVRNGKVWYVVIYGDYPSKEAAKAAIKHLPQAVKKAKLKPWVRQVKDIQNEINKAG